MTDNPLLVTSELPNKAPYFDRIEAAHYMPALDAAIEEARANIRALKDNQDEADFENTIVALETASDRLGDVAGVFYHLLSVCGTEEIEKIAEEFGPKTAGFSSEVLHDPDIFKRVKAVYDRRDTLGLTGEQQKLLDDTYKEFVRGGALLDKAGKKRLTEISQRMAVLSPAFSNNVKKATESYELVIEDEAELSGVPETALNGFREAAKEKGLEGKYVLTLDAPAFIPVLQYADNRDLREKLWRAYTSRAWQDEFDNTPNILETVALRHERANLLGYETHAHYVLERRMTGNPETVWNFINEMKDAYKPGAEADLEAIRAHAKERDGLEDIKPWDVSYYGEKLKEKLYDFSTEELRPYFPLENVLSGMFDHFTKLFNISFRENPDYPVWHEDVKAYDAYDETSGKFLGALYCDFYPRKGKRQGAWKGGVRGQGLHMGAVERPLVVMCCNFTKPAGDKPSLLTHDEVATLFHEMGHVTHELLSDVTYASLGGTSVMFDFVELPSQLQENWVYKKETLDMFAGHYETGEKIPAELIGKMNAARRYMAGWAGLRQVSLGMLDMRWHDRDNSEVSDPAAFEDEILKDVTFFLRLSGPTSNVFGHLFAGGYSCGYYGYKWAEVLDADAFEAFEENGLYDRETAERLKREILSKGGRAHPAELYRNFRGRDADPSALLRREGLEAKAVSERAPRPQTSGHGSSCSHAVFSAPGFEP